jgi:uncharacterized membrane protein YgcG
MLLRVRQYGSVIAIVIGACQARPSPSADGIEADTAAAATATAGASAAASATPAGTAVVEHATPDAGVAAADTAPTGPTIIATASPTPILSEEAWPAKDPTKATEDRKGVVRLGYLRKGQAIEVVRAEPSVKQSCPEGWFELKSGGFVCGKYATRDPQDKALKNAPHAPLTEGALPYQYGLNLTNGTPLYRRLPLRAERKQYEHGLAIGKKRHKKTAEGAEGAEPAAGGGGGTGGSAEPASGGGGGGGGGGAGETPWYLQDHRGSRPQISLDDIKGENGLIDVRMVRGFYLALDQEVNGFSGKFWRTTTGEFAPADHVLVHKPATEFEGVWVGKDEEKRKLPIGWIFGKKARKFTIEDGKAKGGDHIERFTIVKLTGKSQMLDGRGYFETDQGFWMRDFDGTVARPAKPPADVGASEKWIDVNLKTQTLVAYEGDKPVFATIVSTGRHDDFDKAKDHRTVQGSFTIREKHIASTMEDNTASDGPYSIQDVPWIMYFHGSYALHGAFWHSMFGHERSHGCVNMTPHDAKEVFGWVGPTLPPHWHGVFASKENPGTRVIVHE